MVAGGPEEWSIVVGSVDEGTFSGILQTQTCSRESEHVSSGYYLAMFGILQDRH